jgi:beta-N-acetylhexosaminidase
MIIGNLSAMPLSDAEKSYQVIISRIDGLKVTEPEYRNRQLSLVNKGIGGFIIFGGLFEEIREFISEAQRCARIPLFIASDIERGVGQQIEGMTLFPSQMSVAAAIDPSSKVDADLLHDALITIAAEAGEIGINMAFSPVLDINRNPDNPIICTRAFSDDPETVSWFGLRYIRAFEEAGILSCGKHFPGHGDTSADSHIELPVIRKSKGELYSLDLIPFLEAVRSGASCIMTGHLSVPSLDTRPASLSEIITKKLLRQEMGFNGLALTDALNMHALREFGDAGLECLRAGADILLHPEDADATASSILSALEENRLDIKILDSSVDRIIQKKSTMKKDSSPIKTGTDSPQLLSERISGKSITPVKISNGILPLGNTPVKLIFSGDEKYFGASILPGKLQKTATGSEAISEYDLVVIAIFTSVAAWHGSSGISDDERDRLNAIISKAGRSIVISFGSPYVLRHFDKSDILIAAYEPTIQAQQAALDCLTGKAPFSGKLPVNLFKE